MRDLERWTTPLDEDYPGDPWAESLVIAASDVIALLETRDAIEDEAEESHYRSLLAQSDQAMADMAQVRALDAAREREGRVAA